MDAFLTGGGEDAEGTAASPPPRLFVWVPRRGSAKGDVDDDGGDGGSDGGGSWDVARASTDSFEASNMGAIVFVNSAGAAGSGGSASAGASATALIKSAAQVQCMTISPRIYAEEEEGEGAAGGGGGRAKRKRRPKETRDRRGCIPAWRRSSPCRCTLGTASALPFARSRRSTSRRRRSPMMEVPLLPLRGRRSKGRPLKRRRRKSREC